MSEIRLISLEELKKIYRCYMKKDFPARELRPYINMSMLTREGRYISYGCFEDGELRAYACLILQRDRRYALLDYFAVLPEFRGQGIGSTFLTALLPQVPIRYGLFIEAESPDSTGNLHEQEIRRRRLRFYQKNRCVLTSSRCLLFGIDYCLLFLPEEGSRTDEGEIYRGLRAFYAETYRQCDREPCKLYRMG